MKTAKLTGAALDWAVAKCEGMQINPLRVEGQAAMRNFKPSTDWAQGGPIIEREKIGVAYEPSLVYDDSCRWKAMCAMSDNMHEYGPTPLIAAMRCYVATKLGDDIEIPKELT